MRIWFTPTGVCTTNVGMPVSWQMAPSSSSAMSMFCKNDVERLRGLRLGRFRTGRQRHGGAHVGRKIGGGLDHQIEKTVRKEFHHGSTALILAGPSHQRPSAIKSASRR